MRSTLRYFRQIESLPCSRLTSLSVKAIFCDLLLLQGESSLALSTIGESVSFDEMESPCLVTISGIDWCLLDYGLRSVFLRGGYSASVSFGELCPFQS